MKVTEPSWWTDGVFEDRPVKQMLAVRDFGAVFRFLKTRGWSRAAIASATGLTETRVRAVAQGKQQITSYEVLERIAGGLNIDRGLLDLAYAEPYHDASHAPAGDRELPTRAGPPNLDHVPGVGNGAEHVGAMRSFRAADRQVGGGHLYATVIKYLHTEVAPQMFGAEQETDDGPSFTAAAALTETAGWMAHDAGRDQVAGRHFSRSLHLAKLGGERWFQVQVLASLSHLAKQQGRGDEAIRYARQGGQTLAHGPRHPALQGRLLAMQARGFAALARAEQCVQLLHRAETTLAGMSADQQSPWISPFDEASLASEAARCLRQLGDLSQAQRQAERIIALRPKERVRSRAFGQLLLVTILIARGKVEAACAVANDVLDATAPGIGADRSPVERSSTPAGPVPREHGREGIPDPSRRRARRACLALPLAHGRTPPVFGTPGASVSSDAPLYERDPEAWRAHLAEGNAKRPRKRVSADVLIHDHTGRLLLVDPKYKPDWDTPGGMAEANEPPHLAAQREPREELGLDLHVGRLLCVDWVSPHGQWDDQLAFIFDGGQLSARQHARLEVRDDELATFEFCTELEARQRLRPYVWRRVAAAVEALKTGHVQYLQDGYTAGAARNRSLQ